MQKTSTCTWREIGLSTLRRVSFFVSKLFPSFHDPVMTGLCFLLFTIWVLEAFWGLPIATWAALRVRDLQDGALWQPLTYAFCHGPWWHLAINLFVLLVTGCTLERAMGSLRMLALIALAIPAGALGFLLSLLLDPRLVIGTACVGASALSSACFGTIALLAPREKVTLWVLFIPIPFRAGWLLPLAGLLLCAEIFYSPGLTAYGAHLGGWLLGLGFALAVRDTN